MRNTEALGDQICELAAHLNAANCRFLELIAQFGLAINHDTAFPNWDGEPMDRAMAIDGMFTASGDFAMADGSVSAETFAKKIM